jgi:glycosyltransferase involved in cell wall biosynthesis
MKKVILRGPALTQSGYGVHCRQVAEWLLSKKDLDVKFQVLPWGDTPWILKQDLYGNLIEKITTRAIDPTGSKFDVSFQLQLPNEWDPNLADFNIGMTAGIETDRCNPAWIESCNRMDLVIVPSSHAEKSLNFSSQIKKPVMVIPESFSDSIVDSSLSNIPNFSTNFNFLVFGQVTGDNPMNDRKNIFYTIKWLCEVFKDDKDVGIVVKTNLGKNTQIDKKRTQSLLKSIVKECRSGSFPKIHLLHGDMKEEEVASLYRHPQIKALVSLTRGEGYGLPILEAAASGLPIIATGWSGHLDFLKSGRFLDISYSLQEIHPSRIDNRIFVKGAKWAEVIEEDFKKKIKKFRSSDSVPREWAKSLSEGIREKYSKSAIFQTYDKALGLYV